MTQTDAGLNIQAQPDQPRPGAVNPASAQGGQGDSQPGMTRVDARTTAGSTGTQMDQQGRALGVDGHQEMRDGQGQDERKDEQHEAVARGRAGVAPAPDRQQLQGDPRGHSEADQPDTKPSESQP